MTLYDFVKTYGKGKGEPMMWKSVAIISDAVEKNMPEDAKKELLRDIYREMSDGHYNEQFAHEDVSKMYYLDEDGNKHFAPYWTDAKVSEIYDSIQDEVEPYNMWDFYTTVNMIWSDNYTLLKRWFPNADDSGLSGKAVEMAINWLDDPDSPFGRNKIWGYLNH